VTIEEARKINSIMSFASILCGYLVLDFKSLEIFFTDFWLIDFFFPGGSPVAFL